MSKVNAVGKREPSYVRAALKIGIGCVLLGGCSSGGERFSSFSLGSGYEAASAPSAAPASRVADASRSATSPQTAYQQKAYQTQTSYQRQPAQSGYAQTAAYQPSQSQQGGFQLASATPGQQGGYLQASRVDLPPLQSQQQSSASNGVKTADGYGRYNQPPLADGTYAGPRVYTPYNDGPRDYAPPPPPLPPVDAPRYDRDAPPPLPPAPPSYDRRSDAEPPYEPRPRYSEPAPRYSEPAPRDYASSPPPPPSYRDERDFYERRREGALTPKLGPRAGSGVNGTEIKSPNSTVASERGIGKTITVKPGETLYSLAIRHGVTVDMIARANGLDRHNNVRPGMDLLIPGSDPTKMTKDDAPKAQPVGCQGDGCHVVKKGETVAAIARTYGLTEKQVLEANNIANARLIKVGQTLSIPGKEPARQEIASADRVQPEQPLPQQAQPKASAPAERPDVAAQADAPNPLKATPDLKMAANKTEPNCDAALANPLPRMGKTFRKPVEGMIIGQFGPQNDGSVNEGLTISVPKGTPIKAAENGIVAYVGDELPGFGNLILIRHADEYVTAYAHTDEIMVKKCDVVKRGQVVAKAGSTGDASQPQLHFEVRKNAKPVDPSPLLGS